MGTLRPSPSTDGPCGVQEPESTRPMGNSLTTVERLTPGGGAGLVIPCGNAGLVLRAGVGRKGPQAGKRARNR